MDRGTIGLVVFITGMLVLYAIYAIKEILITKYKYSNKSSIDDRVKEIIKRGII